jgi:RNA polymerase sigma-70 factor (ECF subfamily)
MTDVSAIAKGAWQRFLESHEPLRPELFRYCRYLTKTPWDAEDLAQDALARAFATLATMNGAPPNPRAWLFRVASNLWIDRTRRSREDLVVAPEQATESDPRDTREAAGTLLVKLSPQERAAVVLKDVFDLSLEEIAETLTTTTGAVKAALHRARGKLVEPIDDDSKRPAPGALDAFCAALNARDLDRLTSLLTDHTVVEVVGATTEYGPERARKTVLFGMCFGSKHLADPNARGGVAPEYRAGALADLPRHELRFHRGEWLILHWYRHVDGEAVRGITRVELEGEQVAHLRNYFYTPELVTEVCRELDVPFRINGYRYWVTA